MQIFTLPCKVIMYRIIVMKYSLNTPGILPLKKLYINLAVNYKSISINLKIFKSEKIYMFPGVHFAFSTHNS